MKRGGQVYFLHDDVETIQHRRDRLAELIPEARIGVALGQLPERQLESAMRDFVAQRFNLLLCSTIILETAVGRARVGHHGVRWQGATTTRAHRPLGGATRPACARAAQSGV